jgi:hypothetical protein
VTDRDVTHLCGCRTEQDRRGTHLRTVVQCARHAPGGDLHPTAPPVPACPDPSGHLWTTSGGRQRCGVPGCGADRPAPPVVEERACRNYREDLDAPCTGTLRYRQDDAQAACDTCGGWEGVNAPAPR